MPVTLSSCPLDESSVVFNSFHVVVVFARGIFSVAAVSRAERFPCVIVFPSLSFALGTASRLISDSSFLAG